MGTIFFIGNLFDTKIPFELVASFWPVILILLGAEVLTSYCINRDENLKYDFPAVLMIGIMSVFSFVMAFAQLVLQHYEKLI